MVLVKYFVTLMRKVMNPWFVVAAAPGSGERQRGRSRLTAEEREENSTAKECEMTGGVGKEERIC